MIYKLCIHYVTNEENIMTYFVLTKSRTFSELFRYYVRYFSIDLLNHIGFSNNLNIAILCATRVALRKNLSLRLQKTRTY